MKRNSTATNHRNENRKTNFKLKTCKLAKKLTISSIVLSVVIYLVSNGQKQQFEAEEKYF